jgi:hypothetical protein
MTITYTIPGATLLNQLSEPTLDGMPDENANDNCVAASLAEGLHILAQRAFDGDELKDAVYGQGWTGTQSASRYVAYCAQQGVALSAHSDTQAGLIATIHSEVSAGHPVIVTMPSQWGTAPADPVHPTGSTHVGCAVGVGPGEIRVMNPWGGFWQDESDAWWQARLCYGQVWPLQKVSSNVSGVPSGWKDDGATLTAPNGVPVVHGIRAFVLSNSWDASDVPVAPEESVSLVEFGHTALGAGAIQFFLKSGQVSWTPSANTFRTYNGQEEHALRAAITEAQAATAAAQANVTAAQQQHDALTTQLQQTQAQLASAQGQVAALTAQLAAAQAEATAAANAPHDNPQADAALAAMQAFRTAMAALAAS